jgi:hypothetical protein
MAADASAADKLEALAAKLADNAQRLRDGRSATPEEHEELVGTLKQAQEAVYLPRDDLAAMQLGFVTAAAVRLLIHWKVFEKMPDTGSISDPFSTAIWLMVLHLSPYLLAPSGDWVSDPRGQRPCGAHGPDTPLCQCQSPPCMVADGVSACSSIRLSRYPVTPTDRSKYDEYVPVLLSMPRYYDTYGIKEPTGHLHTIKAFTEGAPELTVRDLMSRHPERTANMLLSMSAMASQYPHTGFYDFSWVVPKAAEDEKQPLIMDIGGAKGWTLQAICREIPEIPISRCVLQDLPGVIGMVETVGHEDLRSAQLMAIDFHKE